MEPTRGQRRHCSDFLSQPRLGPPLLPLTPTASRRSKLLDLCPVLNPRRNWTQTGEPFSHRGCDTAITRSQKGPSRSSRGYSCPEPMWVANRRGREGTLAAALFPEVSCSPPHPETRQRCHVTSQREAELSKSLHHRGQTSGKIWLLPLWGAPPCDL